MGFLNWLIGTIVWAAATVVYLDKRRKGVRRGRWIAFLAGYPWTLLGMFLVREGSLPQIEPPPDDEDRLLREVRVDRQLRGEGLSE